MDRQSVSLRNNVHVAGSGPPMLFAHGYGCDQTMWRYITPHFREGHQIVLFDHVGMGHSDATAYRPDKYATLHGYARDVLEICEVLSLRDVIFVGHSVGAMIGLLAAVAEPARFSRMVLLGPSPRYVDEGDYVGGFTREGLEGLLEALDADYVATSVDVLAPTVMGNPDRPELSRELADSFCRTNAELAKRFARVTFLSDNRADLPKVKTPVLIVQSSYDAIAPAVVGQYMHAHIPNSRLVMMRATGHCPNLSAPDETIEAIKSFL